ncbi:S8 family serine peptidase, partial [Candidatus Woesearchaeota archaeon]|nr:S8 family serine peptidase [Candidatus Woesearchaeota archaeon]
MKLKNLFLNLILLDLILVVLFAGHLAIDSILNDKPIALPLNYGAVASNEQALANPSYNPVIQQLSQEAVGVPRATVTSNDNNDYESSNDDDSRPRTRSSRNSNSNSNSLFDLQGYVPTLPIPNNPQPFTYTKTASRVLQRLNEEGNARVIVDLSDPSKKEQVLGILNNFDKKVDMKNGFAGYIDIDDLQALENSPIVDFIYEDRPLHIANAESFPLIQADKAASVTYNNFADLTGAGQTVCLIDTGIDYRHDDLGNCTYDDYINDNCDKFADNGWDFYNTDNDPDDDNGHGTAMAGLIAGNGAGYQGLVPEAKIIAVKISDSTGGSWSSLVDEGVNWCVDNATKFNITVISIGFSTAGTTNNPSICVGPMADEINRAVGDGITVFAPTGNSEVIDGISSPACIPNATAVSAVGDGSNGYTADVIHSFPLDGQGPNRYPGMTDLMAPGLSIDTLDLESFGGYAFGGIGTSYASAHAVGSAMLLKEYYQERYSYDLTPAEIRNILSITGKPIYDINTSAYYPRIDVLAAIHYEEWAPTVNLESPADAATENEGVVSFTYNAADAEHSIDNCTLYIDGQENTTHYYKGSYAKIDTCSEQWMIPCWLSSEGDNTFNTCDAGYSSTGGLGRGGVDEVLINDSYVLDGEDIEVTCKFNLRSKSPVDGGIFYYDGSSWNEIWHQNLPVMDGVYEVKATVNANANIGQHWVRCSYLYDPNNITGYCADEASGDYHHDNDDIYFYVTDDIERAEDREESISYSFDIPLSAASYNWNVQCYDDSTIPNEGVSGTRTLNVQSPDTTPPATITGLTSTSKSTDYIYWEWTNPIDGDFAENIVYIDTVNEINTSNSYYNATGLSPDTLYTITVHTKDTTGNVNNTDVSDAVTTNPAPPAGYLQVLSQTPDIDVTKDDFFSFSIDVKCLNGTCSNVVLTLDPWEDYNFTEEEIAQAQEELNKIKQGIEENNLDWNADLTPAFVDYVRRKNNGELAYIEPETAPAYEEPFGIGIQSAITKKDEAVLPYHFDWRNAYGENWVTSAKHQGGCGSCWAFASVGVAEAALNIYNRWPSLMLDLSEQDMVSCANSGPPLYLDAGDCSSGNDNYALAYIRNTGVVDETCFPYTASDAPCGDKCSNSAQYHIQDKVVVSAAGVDKEVDKEAAIKALLNYGPSTAWIRAYTDLYSYVNGIYEPSTGDNIGAHLINVIGYNETGDYFIVKNSWGTGWGMNGFGNIKSWVVLNDSTILNRLRFTTGADKLNKGVIPMNSGTPFYTITQNPYNCGNMNEGETCSVTWQVNATGFHLSSWEFFVIINSDQSNLTSANSTITIIGDYIPIINSIECESKGTWKDCSLIESGTDLTRIRVNVTDENSNIQNVGVRLKEDGIIIAEGSGAYSSGFYVYDHADKPMDSNKDYKIEVDVSDETYSINGFVSFKPTVVCIEDWQLQYDACQT